MDPKIFVIILIAFMASTIILITLACRVTSKPLKILADCEKDFQRQEEALKASELAKNLIAPHTPKITKKYLEFCANSRICPNCSYTCGSKRVCKECKCETEPRIRLDYVVEGVRHRKLTTLWRREDVEKYYEDLEKTLLNPTLQEPSFLSSPQESHLTPKNPLQEKISKTKLSKYFQAETLFLLKNEGKTLTEIINIEPVSKGQASKMINAFSLSSDGLKNCWKNGAIPFSNVLEIIKISTETNRDQLKVLEEFLESKDHPVKKYSTRLMLSMRRQGKTYKEIVDYLTSNRIKPAKGQKWEISTIRKIVSRYNNQIN